MDIAFDATFRAAAPHQGNRDKSEVALAIAASDIREKIREKRTGSSIVFVVDSSGSMGANRRMAAVKGAILSLLLDAYQRRDRVAMVAFKGTEAEVLLPLTDSVELGKKRLETLPTGGKTPLAKGLLAGYDVLIREQKRNGKVRLLLVVLSDGKANAATGAASAFDEALQVCDAIREAHIHSIVIDTETGFVRLGKMHDLAQRLGGKYCRMESLKAGEVAGIVRKTV